MGDTIEQAIGQEIRRLREDAEVSQSAVAAAARRYGLAWTRAIVAAVELGRKQLSLGELALIGLILSESLTREDRGGRVYDLRHLIPTDDRLVDVGPGLRLPLHAARALLIGDYDDRAAPGRALVANPNSRAIEAAGDAEQKAATAFKTSPEAIVEAAHGRWSRSLTAEREDRLRRRQGPATTSVRTLQALRGHITRELLEELRPMVKKSRGRKRR